MIKTHHDSDQEELLRLCDGRMFTVCDDLNGLRKSAASRTFTSDQMDAFRPDKDHFLIHNVIVGGQEAYGQNKNGDGWPKLACVNRCHTFVTKFAAGHENDYDHVTGGGMHYREHRNRNRREAIGIVKASAWNPELQRIENIKWGHKKKAEEQYELAKSGKNLSYSMSARVPHDRCNCCGHLAKRASDYCDDLKYHMNQWRPEFQKYAFAINDEPTFYDDSWVENPADRIAHYLEYRFHDDELQKAAHVGRVITGTEWAEFYDKDIPDAEEPTAFSLLKLAMLTKLAEDETWLNELPKNAAVTPKVAFARELLQHPAISEVDDASLVAFRSLQPGTLFRELAKRASVLPFISFAAYAQGISIEEAAKSPVVKCAAAKHLPGIFNTLLRAGDDETLGGMFSASSDFVSNCDTAKDASVDRLLDKAGSCCSLELTQVKDRTLQHITQDTLRPALDMDLTKSAADVDSDASVLAHAYGHYQLRALCDMELLRGDDITDAQRLLNVTANRSIYR
jgi:hypothetical protein